VHAAWRYPGVDMIVGPPAALRGRDLAGRSSFRTGAVHRPRSEPRQAAAGPPVAREFWGGPLERRERAILRRSLGVDEDRFLVLLTGGGEGSGGIGRRAHAILRRFPGVGVVAVSGRNQRLKRRLDRLAARAGGRLTVTGFTRDMASWLRCCDVVVGKAGPGTIAEASCCGTPMLLTSHLPGQEAGNAALVAEAGAGRQARRVGRMLAELERLHRDRRGLDALRAGSARLGRPDAAHDIARLIAGLTGPAGPGMSAEAVVPAATSEHNHTGGEVARQ
jgi:1,2-diacylglycerol 3-beta-galactosyltransferase